MMIEYRADLEGIEPRHLEGFFVGWKVPLTPEQHYETLMNSSHVVLAYDDETDRVVGFVNALSDMVSFAFIPMIEVLPEYKGAGIGTHLFQMMLQLLEPISNVDLTCDPPLQSFYERFGMLKSHSMVIRKFLPPQEE